MVKSQERSRSQFVCSDHLRCNRRRLGVHSRDLACQLTLRPGRFCPASCIQPKSQGKPMRGFLLYAALVVLGCANQNLYRTPRDRSVLDESLMVARAVGVAAAL